MGNQDRVSRSFDVLVVGAGPAGLAAACAASEFASQSGKRVGIADDNPAPGGQIWRNDASAPPSGTAATWLGRVRRAGVEALCETRVIDQPRAGLLLAERPEGLVEISYRKLILATGARERFLPFPGWTLPNVMGAGGLQAMVKAGLPVEGKKIVVAGTGPLLLAVAAYLRKRGGDVRLIAEQSGMGRLARFGLRLALDSGKLVQAAGLKWRLRGIIYKAACWPVAAEGDGKLESVKLKSGNAVWSEPCDYLACGFGLVPNLELAALLGCEIQDGVVAAGEWQQTSLEGIYCAGEPTGIGGLELALIEGHIAGYAAAGQLDKARRLFGARRRAKRFQRALDSAFQLREELKALARPGTLLCRCEDVPVGKIAPHNSWKSAKLQTRCGMGPCQGRICGPAAEFLFGWKVESVRPPIFPTALKNMTGVLFPLFLVTSRSAPQAWGDPLP